MADFSFGNFDYLFPTPARHPLYEVLGNEFSFISPSILCHWDVHGTGNFLRGRLYVDVRAKKRLGAIGLHGNGTGWKDTFWGLGLGALSMLVIFIILLGTGAIRVGNGWKSPDFSSSNLVYLGIFIIVGFCEEFLFRGYLMKTLEDRGNSRWFIYILSSILFSVAHMGNMEINAIAVLNIFLVGILFAYMFRVTGSLWMPIGFHITWNYTQGIVFGFPVSGNPVDSIYHTQMVVGQELLSGGGFGPEGGILTTILIGLCMMITWIYGKKTQPPMVQMKYKKNLADVKQ